MTEGNGVSHTALFNIRRYNRNLPQVLNLMLQGSDPWCVDTVVVGQQNLHNLPHIIVKTFNCLNVHACPIGQNHKLINQQLSYHTLFDEPSCRRNHWHPYKYNLSLLSQPFIKIIVFHNGYFFVSTEFLENIPPY